MARKRGNGEGSIYRAGNGYWYGEFKRQKTRGCRTQREAREELDALKRSLLGIADAKAFANLAEFLAHWLETAIKPNRKRRTHESYSAAVERYINPHLGRHKLTDLTPLHVVAAQNALLRDLAPSTVNNHFRAVLRRALNQAMRWGFVARNVVAMTDPPKVKRLKVSPLTIEQARQLLAAVEGHRLEALYRLALSLGLRRGELLALRWLDFNPKAGTLAVRGTLDSKRREGDTKSDSGRRVLELSPGLVDALQEHRRRQRIEATGDYWQDHGLIFPSEVGTPLGPRNLLRHFYATIDRINRDERRAAEEQGRLAVLFPKMTFHALRHACAAFMLSGGDGLEVVKQQLGHSSIKVTSDTYGHLLPGVLREATGRVDNLLAG